MHGAHHTVDVSDTFYCPGHMEGGKMNNYKFIGNCMKEIMDKLGFKELILRHYQLQFRQSGAGGG